eukprot:TRINITY_DN9105_c0_g1_i1.p1 TRINITY_DN9105_c0_g1~~TRINITY_DN9105_c0_g1_i1.p1  ORF type:complete len:240 (-),score=26.42 TRINITY_DN9105_c0_g1_i1:4-723(-)
MLYQFFKARVRYSRIRKRFASYTNEQLATSGDTIKDGDFVLLSHKKRNRNEPSLKLVKIRSEAQIESDFGRIKATDVIQAGYGGSVISSRGKEVIVKKMTLEYYTLLKKRNATPTYPKDSAAIINMLDVKPGSRLLDGGTGSGGLALALSRAVGINGQVWTYELREEFYKMTKESINEFEQSNSLRFFHGDIALCNAPQNYFDGITLDMMQPWLVIPKVLPLLKPGHSLVTLSPNVMKL